MDRSGLRGVALFQASRGSRAVILPVAAFTTLILFAWAASARGAMYESWAQDIFVPLEGVIHLKHGQLPHLDFGTPVGCLYYFIQYLPTLIAPLSARTAIWSNLIVAVVAFSFTAWIAYGRLPAWLAAVTSLYTGLVALSTRQLGEKLIIVTNNASYNRWSWAMLAVSALLLALPHPRATQRTTVIEGSVVGLLLAALFMIKITYFVAGVGLLILALVTVRRTTPFRFGAAAAIVLIVVLASVQISTGMISAYLAEMRATVAVQPTKLRLASAFNLALAFAPGGLVVVLLALWAPRRPSKRWSTLSPILLALAIFAMGWAVAIQNHPEPENPMLPIAALVAWYGGRSFDDDETGTTLVPDSDGQLLVLLRRLASPLVIIGVFLIPMVQDIGTLAWTARGATIADPKLAWLQSTPMRDLRIMATPWRTEQSTSPNAFDNDVQYLESLGEGVSLLRSHIGKRHDVTVLPLTWNNPWPTLLGLRPVRHELAWWHDGRTFNSQIHPDAAQLLGAIDYVFVPNRYYMYDTTIAMSAIYSQNLRRDFHPVGKTGNWTLYARNNCAGRALC